MQLHPRFDLARAIELFPLAERRDSARRWAQARDDARSLLSDAAPMPEAPYVPMPSGEQITSPYDLAIVEQIRADVLAGQSPPGAVPVDAFVFGLGPPPARHLTAIGGVPFRSREKPWPTSRDGRPLLFFAQLSFVDSRDLFPELPGDVLLVFVDSDAQRAGRDDFLFEWVRLGEPTLVDAADVPVITYTTTQNPFRPKPTFKPEVRTVEVLPCYGVIHRTVDFPDDRARFAAFERPWLLSSLAATKLGGIPRYVQHEAPGGGSFFAEIASVQPASSVPYPWDNQPAPLTDRDVHRLPTLKFGDMGSLYLHRDPRWNVSGHTQGY